MEIHLQRTPKLLAQLKELGGDRLVVVGFKLTNGASAGDRLTAVRSISHGTDLVVHNDVTEMDDDRHVATIYRPSGEGSTSSPRWPTTTGSPGSWNGRSTPSWRHAAGHRRSTASRSASSGWRRWSACRLHDLAAHRRRLGRIHRVADHHGEIAGGGLERDGRQPAQGGDLTGDLAADQLT